MHTHNVDDVYELSPLQRGLLLHSVHDGAADMYLSQQTYTFAGRLDPALLVEAWNAAVAVHPAMRTSFHWEAFDTPLQVVHRSAPIRVHRHDWSRLDDAEQQSRLDALRVTDRGQGFDLTTAPLQRLNIVELAPDRYAVIWTYHHLLLDGWSIPVFTGEVLARYQRLSLGGPAPRATPPYRNYIAWLQQQDPAATQSYWTDLLSGVVASHLTALQPWDPRRSTGAVDRRIRPMPSELSRDLRAAAVRHRVTLSTVVQAAWATVLSHHSDTEVVTYGCVSSGRPPELPGVDRMVGMLANTLPMCATAGPDELVGSWLADLQSRHAAMRRYEFTPLADIKRWAGAAGRPLFESTLSIENFRSALDATATDGTHGFRCDSLYDKTNDPIAVTVTPDPLIIDMVIHRERFPDGFVDTLVDSFAAALTAITRAITVAEVLAAVSALAVPAPAAGSAAGTAPPAGPTERRALADDMHRQQILAIFKEVLGQDDIDLDTNFFDLGGDSFDAVRVVSRMDRADLGMLATFPTARELADALAEVASTPEPLGVGPAEDSPGSKPRPAENAGPPTRRTGGSIPRTVRAGPLPLTYQQEGVWYMHKYDPVTTVLHVPTVLLLRGTLDVPALERALHALVVRHESLRTRFIELDGVPHQIIDELPTAVVIELVELDRAAIESWVGRKHTTPFDLAKGVLRMSVARISTQEHVVMLEVHHIAVDGWSSKVLAAELSALYAAERSGSAAVLPEPAIQPVDYAVWQRTEHAAAVREHVEWWRQKLMDVPTLDLPTDRPRPAQPTGAGSVIGDQLSRETTDALHEHARTQRVSVLAVLHAGLLVTLERHSGQHDIPIGSLFTGRSMPETEPVVGYFLSIPVLRVDLGQDTTFAELVRRCHRTIGETNEHLDAPFPLVVSSLAPERLAGRNPLFQVGLTLLPRSVEASLDLGGVRAQFLEVPDDFALWDLSVDASYAQDGRLHVSMEFSTDLFDRDRIERLLQQMLLALTNGLARPDQPYDQLLTSAEQAATTEHRSASQRGPHRLRRRVGRPDPLGRRPRTLDDLITRSLLRRPRHQPILGSVGPATNGQLHRAAFVIAERLQARGVGRGAVVPVALPPGPGLMAAALAVWRTGAALLPIGSASTGPHAALVEVEQSWVISDPAQSERFDAPLVIDWAELGTATGFAPVGPGQARLDDPALVTRDDADQVVHVSHRQLWRQVRDLQSHCGLRTSDVVLWRVPAYAWAWCRQAIWPLVVGAASLVGTGTAPDDRHRSVTVLDCSGAELASLLAGLAPAAPAALRLLCLEGPPTAAALDAAIRRFPDLSVHRMVDVPWSGFVACGGHPTAQAGLDSVTRPVADRKLAVTDDRGRVAPVGVPGSLSVVDRCPAGSGGTPINLDLIARRNPDDTLALVGRRDRYLRSYGHHYHLDTVADALSQLPGVADVVVVGGSDDRPVAYVVTEPGCEVAALDARLRDALAVHLLPSAIVDTPAIPFTPDGRVDTARLAEPGPPAAGSPSDTERVVAAAVRDLLGGRSLGRRADLFANGLDSLRSMQLIAKLDLALGIRLTPREILTRPSIADLASLIDRRHPAVSGPATISS